MGDPPSAVHPVGWMGRAINAFRRYAARWPESLVERARINRRSFLAGVLFMFVGTALVAAVSAVLEYGLGLLPLFPGIPLCALALKGSLAFRSLTDAAGTVQAALAADNLSEARRLLSWHLVSRPVDNLDAAYVASATIESATENFADSVAAPLFWYLLLGLPGAWTYRFIDTADSILGYRDVEREWTGKAAARLDDLLCLIPARLAGWTLVAASLPAGLDWKAAARTMHRDARSCSSPNSGWPMAAAAGALGVKLEKPGTYVLNSAGRNPGAPDITTAIRLLRWSLVLWAIPSAGFLLVPAVKLLCG